MLLQNGKFRAKELTFNNFLSNINYNTELPDNIEDTNKPLAAFLALLGLQGFLL